MPIRTIVIHSTYLLAFTTPAFAVGLAPSCDMTHAYTHAETGKKVYSSSTNLPALYYHTKMNVNTDGAPRSYHPEDPTGKSIAYNNMANAITVAWNAKGQRITCDKGDAGNRKGSCYTEYISAFKGARDINYNPTRFPRIATGHMIPWAKEDGADWAVPCQNKEGQNKGYFVSQTSQTLRKGDACDQSIYVDSFVINAVVQTRNVGWKSQGILTDGGDLVVLRNKKSGKVAYAIHGDRGPKKKLGEGSIALTSFLSEKSVLPTDSYDKIKNLALTSVDYLVFPANDVLKHYGKSETITQEKIDEYGREIFEQWGGTSRLDACSKLSAAK